MGKKKEHAAIKPFTATLIDTGDGTGDAYLPLTDEVVEELGWKEGDAITLSFIDGALVMVKAE